MSTDNKKRHLFLYAKGWYKRTDQLTDLKHICGHITDLSWPLVEERDVVYWLFECVKDYIMIYPDHRLYSLISKWHKGESFIGTALSFMLIMGIDEIGYDLGKPDSKILPLNKEL